MEEKNNIEKVMPMIMIVFILAGTLMEGFNISAPMISKDYEISSSTVSILSSVSLLVMGVAYMIYASLSDFLSVRKLMIIGIVILSLGSAVGFFFNRHDYALKPYSKTVLDHLKENKFDVIGIGKINDIFDGQGITEYCTSMSSEHGMEQTIEILDKDFNGLCFVNLVDFDALWGHRRDPKGYGEELEKFDKLLGTVLKKLNDDDLLFITADHGNDPTYIGTDHTREMVPLLIYSPHMTSNGLIETGDTFANIGATILDNFELEILDNSMGQSILNRLK